MTGFDNKLFGVRDPGSNTTDPLDLYVREASEHDLTWTKIGTAPAGTYALAAYYGRLYALAAASPSSATLQWRAIVPDAGLVYRAPSMLFLNGAYFAIGTLASSGDFVTTGAGTLDFAYTHVARANDGLVFFFNGADTSGVVVRFQADGTYTKLREYAPGAFLLWTHVVYVRCGNRSWTDLSPVKEKVLFYDDYTGTVATGYFDANGDLVNEWSSVFGPGWTHITCTYKGDLFFYASTNGLYGWGALNDAGVYTHGGNATGGAGWQQVVPAGHTYLLFYKPGATSNAGLGELHGSLTSVYSPFTTEQGRLLCGAENGLVLSYEPTSGAARVVGFWGGPQPSSPTLERDITLRTYQQTSFSGGWAHVVCIGIL